jgi:hypothetical protein
LIPSINHGQIIVQNDRIESPASNIPMPVTPTLPMPFWEDFPVGDVDDGLDDEDGEDDEDDEDEDIVLVLPVFIAFAR